MGVVFSRVPSSWEYIHKAKSLIPKEHAYTVTVKPLSFGGQNAKTTLRSVSFKKDSEDVSKDGSSTLVIEESFSCKEWTSKTVKLETTVSFKGLGDEEGESTIDIRSSDNHGALTIQPPKSVFKEIFSPRVAIDSPRPLKELEAAAVKLQKVYKSYRTRRNLADCAVVVEELWWKALDSAALKRCSVSFFDIGKPESVASRWARARTRAAKVGKGLSKDQKAQKLALQHWLEAIDPRHRYGHNLHLYYDVWFVSESFQPFFYWLDLGDGKEVNLERCPRSNLQRQCIQYLGPKEREAYEVVAEDGRLVYKQSRQLVNTNEGCKWIFVLSTSRKLYVGQKKKGTFQHSSFLSGAATTASGRLVAERGTLKAIWPYSGHYHPTEESFNEFISFLQEQNVNLTNVKRCATDDDLPSIITEGPCPLSDKVMTCSTETHQGESIIAMANAEKSATRATPNVQDGKEEIVTYKEGRTKFELGRPLSCKWTTGVGPRIGCVRDYPSDLQLRAMETVNLSPRLIPTPCHAPIPSPRPSLKVRISPRLACMGLPSPRMVAPQNA